MMFLLQIQNVINIYLNSIKIRGGVVMKKVLIIMLSVLSLKSFASNEQPIKFATEATYPPFVSMGPNGHMSGFGVDLVDALCKQMHASCKLVNAPWESLIPSLKTHQYDALFGGMAITNQRKKVVNFSLPYYKNSVVFVSKKNSNFKINMISGKKIGVQGGSQFQNYLQNKYGSKVLIKTYLSNMTALMDLTSGRLDAVFIDQPVAKLWLDKSNNQNNFHIAAKVNDDCYFGGGNGIAISKDNPELLKKINSALKVIMSNGTYGKIEKKWFGV